LNLGFWGNDAVGLRAIECFEVILGPDLYISSQNLVPLFLQRVAQKIWLNPLDYYIVYSGPLYPKNQAKSRENKGTKNKWSKWANSTLTKPNMLCSALDSAHFRRYSVPIFEKNPSKE
jgi:hypothetical protein